MRQSGSEKLETIRLVENSELSVTATHRRNRHYPNQRRLTLGLFCEILQILPLVGLRAFERPKPITTHIATGDDESVTASIAGENDTVIVPAKQNGFERVFLGENCWYAIRISGGMLSKIKYIAAYQTQPISAITYYAPVDHIRTVWRGWEVQARLFRISQPNRTDSLGGCYERGNAGTAIHDLRQVEKSKDGEGTDRLTQRFKGSCPWGL
jgi:hypothetical protein